MLISPARADVFADGGKTPDPSQRTYSDVMREKRLAKEGVSSCGKNMNYTLFC